ncbi:hypothetical protein [Aeoliella sp.]|uniref:hypothetical protein n=1 Tax=Aeoliella sp. TaxID=2795800 RepID=UPI003CCBC574
MSARLYPPLPTDVETFTREHHDAVAQLDRPTAERLIYKHHQGVAPAILRTWPEGEKPQGIALATLLGIVASRAEAKSRWQ